MHVEEKMNEQHRSDDDFFDMFPVPDTDTTELDYLRFENEYLPNVVDQEALDTDGRTCLERLVAARMIASTDDPRVTLLGLLVIGRRPRYFIPGAYVQFLRIAGHRLSDDIVDAAELDGTVSDMLRRLDDKLKAHNFRRVDLVSGDRERRTETYPLVALRELACNAIMHRTYERTNTPVRVTWFDDRIEIRNPGGPFGAVTEANFGQGSPADYRNPSLAKAMKTLGHAQGCGAGIRTAQRCLREAGHPDTTFITDPVNVLAVVKGLPGPLVCR